MAKLNFCKSCGKDISNVSKCPDCGGQSKNFFMKHKILTVIVALLFIGAIAAAGSSTGDDVSKAEGKEQEKTQQQELRNFNVGETAEKKDSYRVSVNSFSEYQSQNPFMQPTEGNKYIVANITVENLSADRDIVVSSLVCFTFLGLDGTKYDLGLTDVGSQIDGTVAPGRKLTGNIAYVVPAGLTEGELEVKLDAFTGKPIYFKGAIQ